MDKIDKSALYDKRVEMIKSVIKGEKTEYVPIISMAQTWAPYYAGVPTREALSKGHTYEYEVYAKHLIDFDFDAVALFPMNRPLKLQDDLGYNPFFIGKDGYTIQHSDNMALPEEEIEEYIADPIRYLRNKVLYRRFPTLRGGFFSDMKALTGALKNLIDHKTKMEGVPGYLREHVGTPAMGGDLLEPALDRYICYRSFAEGMKDLRRRPEQVIRALEVTYPLVAPMPGPVSEFPYPFLPILTATYLNRKNFEKFFWPTFKRAVDDIVSRGGKVMMALEGNWGHIYDYLLEFPKGSIIACLEGDDLVQAKKDIGDKITLVGGISVSLLRDGTKEENIDAIKRIYHEIGTEGYLFAANQALLSPGDVNPENMKAVNDFIHNYRP